jgi:hypothetical protein
MPEATAATRNIVAGSCCMPPKRGGVLTGPNPTDRSKRGTKYHAIVASDSLSLAALPSGANLHDARLFPGLLSCALAVCVVPWLHADAEYDSADNRALCRNSSIPPLIRKIGASHRSGLGAFAGRSSTRMETGVA